MSANCICTVNYSAKCYSYSAISTQKGHKMHQNTPFETPKLKIFFWGGGTAPSPDPSLMGRGTPPPQYPIPIQRLWRLNSSAFGAGPPPMCPVINYSVQVVSR